MNLNYRAKVVNPDSSRNELNEDAALSDSGHGRLFCEDACPKCGQQTAFPTTHTEEPDLETYLKIQSGELIWIRKSIVADPYGYAANRKCVCCEFEWRERF